MIFDNTLFVNAFLAGTMVAIVAPLVGCFLINRQYSLLTDTLAHVSLLGVAIASVVGGGTFITAFVVTVFAGLVMEALRQKQQLPGDTILSLFLTGGLALAVLVLSMTNGYNAGFLSVLFGSITTITSDNVRLVTYLVLGFVLLIALMYKRLFFVTFDEDVAKVSGQHVFLLNAILISVAAVTVVASMKIVGVLLIGALSVVPAITAARFACSFRQTVLYSICISVITVWGGLVISYWANASSGATIVVLGISLYLLSLLMPQNTCSQK